MLMQHAPLLRRCIRSRCGFKNLRKWSNDSPQSKARALLLYFQHSYNHVDAFHIRLAACHWGEWFCCSVGQYSQGKPKTNVDRTFAELIKMKFSLVNLHRPANINKQSLSCEFALVKINREQIPSYTGYFSIGNQERKPLCLNAVLFLPLSWISCLGAWVLS